MQKTVCDLCGGDICVNEELGVRLRATERCRMQRLRVFEWEEMDVHYSCYRELQKQIKSGHQGQYYPVIRCCSCEYFDRFRNHCKKHDISSGPGGFCSFAKRSEE